MIKIYPEIQIENLIYLDSIYLIHNNNQYRKNHYFIYDMYLLIINDYNNSLKLNFTDMKILNNIDSIYNIDINACLQINISQYLIKKEKWYLYFKNILKTINPITIDISNSSEMLLFFDNILSKIKSYFRKEKIDKLLNS